MADSEGATGHMEGDEPKVRPPPKNKRKFKPGPEQQAFVDMMLKREAAWLPFSVVCFAANYTICRLLPASMGIWLVVQIALLAVFFVGLTIWILWTQINAIDVSTRDETPFNDKQASNDMGWTYYAYFFFVVMYGIAGVGLLLSWIAPDRVSADIIGAMHISLPIVIYTPFAWMCTEIDRGPIATLYQRIVSLKMRNTRFEQQNH